MRFTTRSNIEFMVSTFDKVPALIQALQAEGFPVGGTGNSVSMISHTQGWLHCDIPGTDASGVVKSLMDMMYKEFISEEMPNRVRITTSCCQVNCGGQGDISINVQYTKPPKINHDLVANVCERPAVVARCPVAAIRPAMVNGKPSLEVDEKKCVCCGACYPPCPPMQINGADSTKLAVWVGGKHSNARSRPTFHKLVVANLPNNPPRWPEVEEVVRKILYAYKRQRQGLGAHGRVDRSHRLAALLRADRTRLHQAPPRYLGRRTAHHEHVDARPLLSSGAARTREIKVKLGILVNEGPYTHQASDSAYQFTKAALQKGHEIFRVFFYNDGVNNGTRLTVPPQDDRNLQKAWSELAEKHKLDLVVCIAAAQRRGILDEGEAKRHGKDADNIAPDFRISGLGQLIEAGIDADRLVTFGD